MMSEQIDLDDLIAGARAFAVKASESDDLGHMLAATTILTQLSIAIDTRRQADATRDLVKELRRQR